MSSELTPVRSYRREGLVGVALLLGLALVGLYLVKWDPYFHKALRALATHSLGDPIVYDRSGSMPRPSLASGVGYALTYFKAVWQAMLLGLLMATTIETFIPRDWLMRLLGSRGLRASALGALLALPCMMCTCCVAPVVRGLRRRGASVGSATAFFLGNPTLNPAVIVFMLFVLGWRWALLRLVLGLALVLGSAAIAGRLADSEQVDLDGMYDPQPTVGEGNPIQRWVRNFVSLLVKLVPEYVVIVLLLGALRAYFFPDLQGASVPWWGVILLALLGTLFVIPTAGEVPIVQAMLAAGLGPAPAAALLMTLAPISLPSIAMVWTSFPRRVLLLLAALTCAWGVLAAAIAAAVMAT